MHRRAFLINGSLFLTVAAGRPGEIFAANEQPALKIGLVTDLHYADKAPAGTRHYRETLRKLDEAGKQFEKTKPEFVVELGDLIDAADSVETELSYLKTINRRFSSICKNRHYVLGNHCVDTLKKDEFLGEVGQKKSFYSFDQAGYHFVILDSCFRSDGKPYERKNFRWTDANVPDPELEWLESDLTDNQKPAIVFAHQRLDVATHHGVKNANAVRKIFETAGNVRAVFQGHSHQNDLKEINGVSYCTLVAMVEGSGESENGYSLMSIHQGGLIELSGFRKQKSHKWNQNKR